MNSTVQTSDPRFTLQVNGQVTFADLVVRNRFHLISPFLQGSAILNGVPGASLGGGFAIGNQVAVDLIEDKLRISLQFGAAAQWTNLGRTDSVFSVLGRGSSGSNHPVLARSCPTDPAGGPRATATRCCYATPGLRRRMVRIILQGPINPHSRASQGFGVLVAAVPTSAQEQPEADPSVGGLEPPTPPPSSPPEASGGAWPPAVGPAPLLPGVEVTPALPGVPSATAPPSPLAPPGERLPPTLP